jgi:hypothetical protein
MQNIDSLFFTYSTGEWLGAHSREFSVIFLYFQSLSLLLYLPHHAPASLFNPLTLSLLMSYICGAPSKARNLTYIYIYWRNFLLGILLLEPCISLIYAWKTNKYTNYSFSLLTMYGSSYLFQHYIAILRECS